MNIKSYYMNIMRINSVEDGKVLKEGIPGQFNLVEESEPVGPVCVSFG